MPLQNFTHPVVASPTSLSTASSKRGKNYFFHPLSAAGEERVDKRSDVGVSR